MMNQTLETIDDLEYAIFTFHSSPIAIKLKYLERFNLIEKIIKIPRSPSFILGVIRIEKAIIPLIDLEILLGSSKQIDLHNAIALVITVENNVFALFVSSVPKVIKFEAEDILEKIDTELSIKIPSDWIDGYIKGPDSTDYIPIINPKLFWVGLGDVSIAGPSLQYQVDLEDEIKVEEPAEEIKVEEPAEEIKVEEPAEEIKVEEPAEEIKVEEPADEFKMEEPTEEIKVEEPAEEEAAIVEIGEGIDIEDFEYKDQITDLAPDEMPEEEVSKKKGPKKGKKKKSSSKKKSSKKKKDDQDPEVKE